MSRRGRKKPKRTRPVHDRQKRKQLVKDVQQLYGSDSAAEEGDAVYDPWHDDTTPPSRPRSQDAKGGSPPIQKPSTTTVGEGAESSTNPADQAPAKRGRVVALGSGLCTLEVLADDGPEPGRLIEAILPSRLAAEQQRSIAVGDLARFETTDEGHRLRTIEPRRSELARPDPHNPRRQRVLAANIDVVVVVMALVEPPLRPALIDRYRIAIERGGARPLLVINKVDQVADPEDRQRRLAVLAPYRATGLEVLTCSAKTGEGIQELRRCLAGRIAAFVGHSGVGKSSLANALDPDLDLETRTVGAAGSGRHTTTRSSLFHLPGDVHLIDTPGVREFGLWRLEPDELRSYFPDFEAPASTCRFNNCSHTHEPDCGVRDAVDRGAIPTQRYATYRRILDSLES